MQAKTHSMNTLNIIVGNRGFSPADQRVFTCQIMLHTFEVPEIIEVTIANKGKGRWHPCGHYLRHHVALGQSSEFSRMQVIITKKGFRPEPPIPKYCSMFISYSSKDKALAKRLYADLQAKGVRCWFAPEDLKIGDKFRTEIDRAIRVHDKLLLLLSASSILSDWVEKEVETAFDRERRDKRTILFPIRLDDTIMDAVDGWAADIRRSRHIGDFTNWKDHDSYQKAFDRLLRDLKSNKPANELKAKT
jgi:hypothetical protein